MALERHIAGQRPDWAKWPKSAEPSWVRRPMIHAVRRKVPWEHVSRSEAMYQAICWKLAAQLAMVVATAAISGLAAITIWMFLRWPA